MTKGATMNAPRHNVPPIDPRTFADSTRALLTEDPRRYRNFGVYWFLVKALLKRHFDRHNLYFLGDYEDPDVIARMPGFPSVLDALQAAAEEYQQNASFNLGRNRLEDPDGEVFTLIDPDVEG